MATFGTAWLQQITGVFTIYVLECLFFPPILDAIGSIKVPIEYTTHI